MKRFRVIYSVEEISKDGDLLYRDFAANKKTADWLKKKNTDPKKNYVEIRKLHKCEHMWVNPEDVVRR